MRSESREPDARPHELSAATRLGLWFVYTSSPSSWARIARGFGLKVEPSDLSQETLRKAEISVAEAVRFAPVTVAAFVATGFLLAWGAPALRELLARSFDAVFFALLRLAVAAGLDHNASEITAYFALILCVWSASLLTALGAFAPVWWVCRRQVLLASPLVSVALALGTGASAHETVAALDGPPRVRIALGRMLATRRRSWGSALP